MGYLKGGAYLFQPAEKDSIFLPENASEEQNMIFRTCQDFVKQEIYPVQDDIEAQKDGLAESLFKKMGDLGLLGLHMPEEYGGSDLDANTVALMLIGIGTMGSFNTPFAAHTGIGMLPFLYFGTDAQKEKYLPPMITGDLIASYCLTEPTSGSDALSAKTLAKYNKEKGTYVLNGQKMWISNAGYAGIFIVFAKLDGDKFTAFVVERDREGLTLGEEEKKLGIHGSSTRQVFLEDVKIPEENLLGEIGKGHLIAFNVLNMGRFKLGTLCLAGCKEALRLGSDYAGQRVQFGQPIASFGAIQYKIANMAVETAALSSATFRLSESLTDGINKFKADGHKAGEAKLLAAKDFAIECSVLKVVGSEALDYCVDELVQIYGGMGYSEEAPPASMYRDSRINRIYEGTNEINRLLIVDQLFKRGMKGDLPLMDIIQSAEVPQSECEYADDIRRALVKLLGYVGRAQMEGNVDLEKDQQLVMALSNIAIELYVLESLWMRIEARKQAELISDIEFWQKLYELKSAKSFQVIRQSVMEVLSSIFSDEVLTEKLDKVLALLPIPNFSLTQFRKDVAQHVYDTATPIQ
ncbi:MAG: acyl-CoA dehydrogenase family protein [Saprospiraceae bacterium]|nr:acyl-CoA dehydrogenase family protein [Saprospiraceae bacterium]